MAAIGRPDFLPRDQVLYLDAVEESFQMATLAYVRLQHALAAKTALSTAPSPGSEQRSGALP